MQLPIPSKYPKRWVVKDEYYYIRFAKVIRRDKKCLGLCCPTTRIIWIKKGLPPKETFKTFLHEVFHAIEFEYDIELDHDLIHALEEPIALLFLDNF